MIPKKIHYCWFGKNELPTKAKTIMMYIKMLIRRIRMTTKSSHF